MLLEFNSIAGMARAIRALNGLELFGQRLVLSISNVPHLGPSAQAIAAMNTGSGSSGATEADDEDVNNDGDALTMHDEESEVKLSPEQHQQQHAGCMQQQPSHILRAHRVPMHVQPGQLMQAFSQFQSHLPRPASLDQRR
jgi:hypothetical protein